MDPRDNSQLELFNQNTEAGVNKQPRDQTFIKMLWSYEKAILMTFAFIVTALIAFSLGVEKGKQVSLAKRNALLDVAGGRPEQKRKLTVVQPAIPNTKAALNNATPAEAVKLKEAMQGYIIQLASYNSKTAAQREAEYLKKKGLNPLLFSSKGYTVLCIGGFNNRQKAQSLLSELRKRFRDCYIRRL